MLPYIVFVLQLPAYLPVYLAPERYGRASAEFSITLLLVNLPCRSCHPVAVSLCKAMALDKGNNDSYHCIYSIINVHETVCEKYSQLLLYTKHL